MLYSPLLLNLLYNFFIEDKIYALNEYEGILNTLVGLIFALFFIQIGKIIKNAKDGILNKIVPYDKSITFWYSLVSKYNQIKAKSDVNGMEIIIAPRSVYFFATSETTTTTKAVIINLTK